MSNIVVNFNFSGLTVEEYNNILIETEPLRQEKYPGLLFHVAAPNGKGMFVCDIWESEAYFNAFGAIMIPALIKAGGTPAPPSIFPVHNVINSVLLNSGPNNDAGDGPAATSRNQTKETFSIRNLVKEDKKSPDANLVSFNAQHHQLKLLESRTVPGPVTSPEIKNVSDYAVALDKMPVINPGPGEYVHVMEGQRNGYENLTIGITETFPGGAPPMHSHEAEESHVLLEGEILYALGDSTFTAKAPYMVNIPAGMPHAFKNVGTKTANLVVIFPCNVWKYEVLDYFPFNSDNDKQVPGITKLKDTLVTT